MIGFTKPILDTEIATISDGKDITRGYVTALAGWLETQDEILRRGGGDLKIYEQVRRDDQVQACLEQRILAHSSQEWEVIPASKSKADHAAADFIREQVAGIPWDRISQKMHLAVFYGHKEAEAIYTRDGKNVVLDDTRGGLRVKDARRFRYDEDGNLRLLTFQDWQGEIMPPKKFWTLSYGNTHDDDHYGIGLAYWLYYPCLFKRGGLRSWLQYLDKFAQPTVVGKYPAGTDKDGRDTLKAAVRAFASQTGVMIPEGMMLELAEASRSGTADYSQLVGVMNEAISKIIVGQTMTTDDGSSEAQANVHMDVRQDLVKSDADLINESANGQWVRWLTEWNFPDAKPPKLWRKIDVEEDLNARVSRDKTLFDLGWQLTAEKFAEVYGDGYEQKPQDSGQQDPVTGLQGVLGGDNSPEAVDNPQSEATPNGVSFEEFFESLEAQFVPVEFAQKQCKKGWPCGGSCISQSKSCNKVLSGQAATYTQWLQQQAQTTGVVGGGTAAATPAQPAQAARNTAQAAQQPTGVVSGGTAAATPAQPAQAARNTAQAAQQRVSATQVLQGQTKASLQGIAASLGVNVPKSATKARLIQAITQAQAAQPVSVAQSSQRPPQQIASPLSGQTQPRVVQPSQDIADLRKAIEDNDFDKIAQISTRLYSAGEAEAKKLGIDFIGNIRGGNGSTDPLMNVVLRESGFNEPPVTISETEMSGLDPKQNLILYRAPSRANFDKRFDQFKSDDSSDYTSGRGIYCSGTYVAANYTGNDAKRAVRAAGSYGGSIMKMAYEKADLNMVKGSALASTQAKYIRDLDAWRDQEIAKNRPTQAEINAEMSDLYSRKPQLVPSVVPGVFQVEITASDGGSQILRGRGRQRSDGTFTSTSFRGDQFLRHSNAQELIDSIISANAEFRAAQGKGADIIDSYKRIKAVTVGDDEGGTSGRFAILKGFDFVRLDQAYDTTYGLLLNRSKIKVQSAKLAKGTT